MFKFEYDDNVILESKKALEAALSTSPKAQIILRKIIRKYLKEAYWNVVNNINFKNGDPRGTRYAVRTTVYKKVLGANINIYQRGRAKGEENSYEPPRKLRPGQRGGNRVKRGERTNQVMHYGPLDRGWILYILNKGTDERISGTRGGKISGNRGSISARNFFKPLGDRALGIMRDNLSKAIEEEMEKLLSEQK
jgi:hypothetical protein